MYAKYGHPEDDYIAAMCEDPENGRYAICFHHEGMPAFACNVFGTLAQAKSWAKTELGITHWRGLDGQFVVRPD